MSHDQRPSRARVRVIASSDVGAAPTGALRAGDVVATPSPETNAPPAKAGMLLPSLMFCLGCALGGAGLGVAMLAR
jgi:hypothetical protein